MVGNRTMARMPRCGLLEAVLHPTRIMKIVHDNPPILESILAMGMIPTPTTVYTYGDTLYNPSGQDIPDHLLHHEETHEKQQGADPDAWWDRYLQDQYFRIEQETEAYARQFAFICRTVKDRNRRHKILFDIARILAGPIYGNVIGTDAAMRAIKTRSDVK
jgi:hypothetical protein